MNGSSRCPQGVGACSNPLRTAQPHRRGSTPLYAASLACAVPREYTFDGRRYQCTLSARLMSRFLLQPSRQARRRSPPSPSSATTTVSLRRRASRSTLKGASEVRAGLMLPQAPDDGDGGSWAEIERARAHGRRGRRRQPVGLRPLPRSHDASARPATTSRSRSSTAVAAVTTRVEIGPLVAATSFRSAGMLAKIAATLDSVARGRLILGLGCGWHEPEYRAFGYPFDHRVGRFEEIVHGAAAAARWRARLAGRDVDAARRRGDPARSRRAGSRS